MVKRILSYLIILNLAGNICSQQVYFNNRFELDSPGSWDAVDNCIETEFGYVISGGTGHPGNYNWRVIAFNGFDSIGNKIWTKTIGDTISHYYNGYSGSLIQLSDNNYAFGGGKRYPGDTVKDMATICKLNYNWDTLWLKEYGNLDHVRDTQSTAHQIKECYNGDLIVVGSHYYNGSISKHMLMRTDSVGNIIWENTYGTSDINIAYTVIQTTDGGFAIGGFWYEPGSSINTGDPIIIKTDSLGNVQWQKNIGGPYKDNRAVLCNGIDGSIIAGTVIADSMSGSPIHGSPQSRIYLIKLDNEGNTIWDKKYGNSSVIYNYLKNVRCLADGSIVACGSSPVDYYVPPGISGWVLKINSVGDSLWYRSYANLHATLSENRLFDIIHTSDDGFLACGYVFPMQPDTGTQDAWIIKLDSMGCDTPGCFTVGLPEQPFAWEGTGGELYIYPNPSTEYINVQYPISDIRYSMHIYNIYGCKQDEIEIPKGQKETSINISGYSPGVYVAVLKNNRGMVARGKFVKR
jgi:hypothetical protein